MSGERTTNEIQAESEARDPGLNSILLDMATKLGTVIANTEAIKLRLAIIEPTLWTLETERQRKIGLRDGVIKYVTLGKSLWLAAGAIITWIAAHFYGLPR